MNPTAGRIVLYKLTDTDAQVIRSRRAESGVPANEARAGDVYPAVVVRVWGGMCVNLRVLLDGLDDFWATSRVDGDAEGQWSWPPRV
jgi:hypothetical protein